MRTGPDMEIAPMREALETTQNSDWILSHEGYNVLTESAVESRLAFGNGFLGMRAARSVSRGPTWVAWLGYSRWASWPRCYVAGLFDMPNTEPPVPALVPVADWSRVRILLDGEPLLAREGEVLLGTRKLDMRRGVLVSAWTHRTPAGITAAGRELRLLSLADRAAGLQLLQFSLDRDGVDVRLEASFAMAGLGMEPVLLEQDLGAWQTEGTRKGVAMTGAATLRLGDEVLAPDRPFSLRWAWRWRSAAGQVAEFDRLIAVARADTPQEDPAPPASAALARNRALGWLAAYRIGGDQSGARCGAGFRFAVMTGWGQTRPWADVDLTSGRGAACCCSQLLASLIFIFVGQKTKPCHEVAVRNNEKPRCRSRCFVNNPIPLRQGEDIPLTPRNSLVADVRFALAFHNTADRIAGGPARTRDSAGVHLHEVTVQEGHRTPTGRRIYVADPSRIIRPERRRSDSCRRCRIRIAKHWRMGDTLRLHLWRDVGKGICFVRDGLWSSVNRTRLELCGAEIEMEGNVKCIQPDHRLYTAMNVFVPAPCRC